VFRAPLLAWNIEHGDIMTPQLLFGISSKIALLGWVGLVFGGRMRVILRPTPSRCQRLSALCIPS
jgi:hypothetical protein